MPIMYRDCHINEISFFFLVCVVVEKKKNFLNPLRPGFVNLGHRLLKHLVIQTAAAELAAAVCITSHFNNNSPQHTRRHVGI